MFVMQQHSRLLVNRASKLVQNSSLNKAFSNNKNASNICLALLFVAQSTWVSANEINLRQAIDLAIEQDLWLDGSHYEEQALIARGNAALELPDPTLSFKLANLPVDTLSFSQEGMTQVVAGINQQFPPGKTRDLKQKQFYQKGSKQVELRANRKAQIELQLSKIWLDYQQARQSERLLRSSLSLFDQLTDITEASYSSAFIKVGQDDLLKAQLERIRVDDRLTRFKQQADMSESKLQQWLFSFEDHYSFKTISGVPKVRSVNLFDKELTSPALMQILQRHPRVIAVKQQISAAVTGVNVMEQQYEPQWGVNASYGYRGSDQSGRDRADLFSVGVTLKMPLFGSAKQDSQVQAAVADVEQQRTKRLLLLRQLRADYLVAKSQHDRLLEREKLYQQQLLPKAKQRIKSAASAYEVDNGSYADVIRARITELNTRLELLKISVERQRQIIQINYLLAGSNQEQQALPRTDSGIEK